MTTAYPNPKNVQAVAVIPARGGSKGVKGKNLRTVGGKSLVARSVIHALSCPEIKRVIVTSDSDEILEEAARQRTSVELVKRPAELATDDASGDEVLVHALTASGFDGSTPEDHLTVLLLPTSPIRPAGLITNCIWTLRLHEADSLLTVYPGHFAWYAQQDSRSLSRRLYPVRGGLENRVNRQDIKPEHRIFIENGSVYVSKTRELIRLGVRLFGNIQNVEMSREDSIDIDTEYDLWLAETRVKYLGPREACKEIFESPVPVGYRP